MDLQAAWQAALGELELTLSKANFTTWFKNTFISSYDGGTRVVIAVPNTFTKAWLEKKYHEAIMKALRSSIDISVREVIYRVEVKNTTILPLEHTAAHIAQEICSPASEFHGMETGRASNEDPSDIGLNPRYTFSRFVVGKNNELAHASAMAVATKPGQAYNPLYVYGGVGMGKTHLLQAIGRHLATSIPSFKIRYVTSERFTNEFIQAVRSGHGADFKDTYRNIDALIVDDIQFFAGKEGTQEEFFHTFNALHQNNKQLILASDRQPKDIPTLESRLLSRFEWGMVVDITQPDFETRVAILQEKTREKSYTLSTELLHLIAGAIQSNIRELEGALNKIIAYHQFKNIQPDPASIQSLLQSFSPSIQKRIINSKVLLDAIAQHYDLTLEDIMGKSRERRFALPRQIAMYLLREETKCSFPSIGNQIGGRDHTTAMHACHKISCLTKDNEQMRRDLNAIRERLYGTNTPVTA